MNMQGRMDTQPENSQMEADDSHLVDEILNELNDGNETSVQNNTEPVHVEQPTMQINEMPNVPVDTDNFDYTNMPQEIYEEEPDHDTSLFQKVKKPLLVVCLAFIVFNPLFLNILSKYIPRVFGLTDNVFIKQGRTLLIATVLGMLYFASNLLV
jgi:hypothetical protein